MSPRTPRKRTLRLPSIHLETLSHNNLQPSKGTIPSEQHNRLCPDKKQPPGPSLASLALGQLVNCTQTKRTTHARLARTHLTKTRKTTSLPDATHLTNPGKHNVLDSRTTESTNKYSHKKIHQAASRPDANGERNRPLGRSTRTPKKRGP